MVKNGSNTRSRSSGGTPRPLSHTSIDTFRSSAREATWTHPPSDAACAALSNKLVKT